MFEPWVPITAKPLWLFGMLALSLVMFDLILVRWLKLGKIAWKRVDYIWLSVAAVGLLGIAADVRRLAASSSVPQQHDIRQSTYDRLVDSVRFTTGGGVCRNFVRTEYSPKNLDAIQREFDAVCEFGRGLMRALPKSAPDSLDRAMFARRPAATDAGLREQYAWIDRSLDEYLAANRRYHDTVIATERTATDIAYTVLSPVLLVVALALRITKVTGEIRIDQQTDLMNFAVAQAAKNSDDTTEPRTTPNADDVEAVSPSRDDGDPELTPKEPADLPTLHPPDS